MNSRTRLPLPEPEYKHWETNQHGHAVLEPTIAYTADQMHAYSDSENAALLVELSGFRSARIAYASEFPLNADGEPDIGNIHANIRAVKARVKVLEDALREYIASADDTIICADKNINAAMLRFCNADKAARAALEATK